jgi:hypothetical protein
LIPDPDVAHAPLALAGEVPSPTTLHPPATPQ